MSGRSPYAVCASSCGQSALIHRNPRSPPRPSSSAPCVQQAPKVRDKVCDKVAVILRNTHDTFAKDIGHHTHKMHRRCEQDTCASTCLYAITQANAAVGSAHLLLRRLYTAPVRLSRCPLASMISRFHFIFYSLEQSASASNTRGSATASHGGGGCPHMLWPSPTWP